MAGCTGVLPHVLSFYGVGVELLGCFRGVICLSVWGGGSELSSQWQQWLPY